ncbi:hypothetical protein GCM10007973_28230 [Polymorphobacter multimanifer]|nr:hypothetical protein GCM10007973_28230 [Polymorphobacter multimanifer]
MDENAFLPGSVSFGWPAPYAEGLLNPWVGQLMKGLPLAVAVLNEKGRIIGGNDALSATIGPDAVRGTDPADLVVPEDRELLSDTIKQVIRNLAGTCDVRVAFLDRPDERQIVTVAPVPPGMGVAAMMATRDVREQRRLEKQVQAATRMQAVGQLAGGIAHDFNNLLTAVLALSEQMMERNSVHSLDHEAAAEIRRNGKRAAALVAQLLAFARRQPQRPQLLDLSELLQGLTPLLMQLVGKGVRLEIVDAGLKSTVRADPGQIEQVIVNLAVNARDAMEGQGEIEIALADVPAAKVDGLGYPIMPAIDHVMIEVRDTGSGIPAAIAGKIFEPFFTTKKLGEGTGLGLSTVYGIVKQSGGFIFTRPRPRPSGGTAFSVYLPASAQVAAPVPPPETVIAPPSLTGKRLLLVEDEEGVRQVLSRGLRARGLLVRAVGDAATALEALASGDAFDALLSDVMMPGIDGVELAARVRAARPKMAVLLMSGFAEPPLHRAAETAGIGFIAKPFSLAELMQALSDELTASVG